MNRKTSMLHKSADLFVQNDRDKLDDVAWISIWQEVQEDVFSTKVPALHLVFLLAKVCYEVEE